MAGTTRRRRCNGSSGRWPRSRFSDGRVLAYGKSRALCIHLHVRYRARSRGAPRPAALLGVSANGRINVVTGVVFGFPVGAAPAAILTWPLEHPGFHASASVDGLLP